MKTSAFNKYSLMALAALMPCVAQAANIDVVATQTVNTTAYGANVNAITANTTWTKDNAYILKDKVFVTNGATLTIEPGTKIYSTLDIGSDGTEDDKFGAIVIVRGAKINAAGTAAEPIVMTTIDELEAQTQTDLDGDTEIAYFPTATTAGRWGGLVVLGSAPIANYSNATTNIGEDRIEGFQPAASADVDVDGRADVIEYGGSTSDDNSGTISYVSIRHGGYTYAANSEINGLTLGGVGSGTTINHVEVFANADDGIEFFGGTVNTSNIVLAFNQDDSFDIDQGYSGTNQFWFSIQAPTLVDGVTSAHDNGGEWDGVTGTLGDYASNSAPIIYNATFIGSGTTALNGNDKGNNAMYLDDRFKGTVYNSVFDDFKEDLIEVSSDGKGTGLTFGHNTIGRFGGGAFTGTNASNLTYLNNAVDTFFDSVGAPINGNSNGGVDPMFRTYTRNVALELTAIDPRPASSSPLLSSSVQAGAPTAAAYRGAFGSTNWAAGWTKMSIDGLLLGEASTGSMADADSDGISDAVETANTDLGFNAAADDASSVLGTLKTTAEFNANYTAGQTSVTSDPNSFSLYNTDDILDLRTVGQTTVQASSSNVTLTVPVQKSTGLNTWESAGNMTLTVPKTQSNEFYRLSVEGAQ